MKRIIKIVSLVLLVCVLFGTVCSCDELLAEGANSGGTSESGSSSGNGNTANSDETTLGQRNALRSAKNYLRTMPFSYSGLIKQLEFEGYKTEEATYAADNCGANWNEQAAKAAKNYLDIMSFSRQGLIEQLEFEGYTYEQAVYGVEANGY